MIGDGERIAIVFVAEAELAFEVGRPEIVGMLAQGQGRSVGTGIPAAFGETTVKA